MKVIKYILTIVLLLQSCNFEDLVFSKDEDDNNNVHQVVYTYEYDDETDSLTKLADGVLVWKEFYDFDEEKRPIFVKKVSSDNIISEFRTYKWNGNNPQMIAYYFPDGSLAYYETYDYSDGKAIMKAEYRNDDTLNYFDTVKYNQDGKVLENKNYNNNSVIQSAKIQSFDDSGEIISKYHFTTNYDTNDFYLKSYITYERSFKYYNDLTATKTQAFGEYSWFGLSGLGIYINSKVKYGEINKTSRNDLNIETPELPAYPTDPETVLIYKDLDFSWMTLEVQDTFGTSITTLNSSFKPTQIKRSAPDYYDGYISVGIAYNDSGNIKSKTTKFNSYELLKLEYDYNETDGFLDSLTVSGKDSEIPENVYKLTYHENTNIPAGLKWELTGITLFDFVYEYNSDVDLSTLDIKDINKNIANIKQYQGDAEDNNLYATFGFNYTDLGLSLNISDADGVETGKIEIGYDDNDVATYLRSFTLVDPNETDESKKYQKGWDYSYSYADFEFTGLINTEEVTKTVQTRLTEIKSEYEDDVENTLKTIPQTPESITGIEIETLLLDIISFIPIDIPTEVSSI